MHLAAQAAAALLLASSPPSDAQVGAGAPQPITGVENAFPAWSPDGAQIVFQSNRSGDWHLYVMRPDGRDLRDLTPSLADCRNPSFSPDGRRIVFYSAMSGNDEIYCIDADGANLVNLTNHPARDIHPHWSPDGARILFNSLRDDPRAFDVYVMAADGSGVERLTATPEDETCAQLSPDGTRAVFLRTFLDGNDDVMISGADFQDARNLSRTPYAREGWPSWSPDGERVLYSSMRTGVFVVYVADQDGGNLRALTDGMATSEDARAAWSPDGRTIAFTRRRGLSMDVWTMPVTS